MHGLMCANLYLTNILCDDAMPLWAFMPNFKCNALRLILSSFYKFYDSIKTLRTIPSESIREYEFLNFTTSDSSFVHCH